MSSYGYLQVGSLIVSHLRNGVGHELLAVFRDDMLEIKRVPARDYYGMQNEYVESEFDEAEYVDVVQFRAPGQHIAARLDAMGITPAVVSNYLESQFRAPSVFDREDARAGLDDDILEFIDRERSFLRSLTAQDWIARLASQSEDSFEIHGWTFDDRNWLLDQINYWDERFALRAVLLSFPDSEVCLDITDSEQEKLREDEEQGYTPVSESVAVMGGVASMHAPIVVLTEGRTDAEFLSAALKILYPYLTDLIRFLDYDQKAEGGAGALVRMVRAFGAAGIVNRIVAVFDNDTAAEDALRPLDFSKLPSQLQVLQYPTIEIASEYPTLGPPSHTSPDGSVSTADVNGLAGSIEMYLGRDVLAASDGELRPVQWKSYIASMRRYQGEVIDKAGIHDVFRAKCKLALSQPETISSQDWKGLRLIIDAIRNAAELTFGGVDPTTGLARG